MSLDNENIMKMLEIMKDNHIKMLEIIQECSSNKEANTRVNEEKYPEPIYKPQTNDRKINLINLIINEPCFKKAIRTNENINEARSPYISKKQVKNIVDTILNKFPSLTNEEILIKMKEMNKKISDMATIDNIEEQLFKRKLNKKEKEIIDECFELKFYLNIKNSIYDNFKWIDELI